MTFHFCTITTQSHQFKVKALFNSLSKINPNVNLHVLVVDGVFSGLNSDTSSILYYSIGDVKSPMLHRVYSKYKGNANKLRWCLKPVFLSFLIESKSIQSLVYVDNDIAFFSDFTFLFEELKRSPILLTPHHYPRFPDKRQNWLEANFKVGLFNAGFIGVNAEALPTLQWWAGCCLYRCEKNAWRGLFDDQKYLDLFPIIEPKTIILQHQGCNVEDWNKDICLRTIHADTGEVLINGKWPVVFIHFNNTTMQSQLKGEDPLLVDYFEEYLSLLKIDRSKLAGMYKNTIWDYFNYFKLIIWKVLNKLN